MNYEATTPFDSIESAHEFVTLLAETVLQARQDIEADIQREMSSNANSPRRLDALRVTLLCLKNLEFNMNKSRRILNDLRSLRRLLFEERISSAKTSKVEP